MGHNHDSSAAAAAAAAASFHCRLKSEWHIEPSKNSLGFFDFVLLKTLNEAALL